MAKIDDCLLRQSRVLARLREHLRRRDFTDIFSPRIESLGHALDAAEKEIVDALFALLLDPTSRSTKSVAYLVLKDLDSERVPEVAETLLARADPTIAQRKRLVHIRDSWLLDRWKARSEHAVRGLGPEAKPDIHESLIWSQVTGEEVGALWMWLLSRFTPRSRAALLLALFRREWPVDPFAAVEVEIAYGDLEVVHAILPLLADRPEPEAESLLRRLAAHETPALRMEADQRLRARTGPSPSFAPLRYPLFHKAHLHENPTVGLHVLTYVVEDFPKRYKSVTALVDTWDRGLVDCLGQNRLFSSDVSVVVSCAGRLAHRAASRPLDGRLAAGWLLEAEQQTRRRGFAPPPSWPIWRRLLLASPHPVAPREVVFGLVCHECARPVQRPDDTEAPPLVLGARAVCSRCLAESRPCAGCGAPIAPRTARACTHPESPRIDFYCAFCYEKRI